LLQPANEFAVTSALIVQEVSTQA